MPATVPELMDALDKAYDEFAKKRSDFAEKKADYERVRLGAIAKSKESSAAAKNAEADVLAAEEKQKLIRAEAMAEITQTHVRVLLGELVAAQSVLKFQGHLDGGTTWENW